MNKESGNCGVEVAFILMLAVLIIGIGLLAASSLDENGNGILDSKENYELYQE